MTKPKQTLEEILDEVWSAGVYCGVGREDIGKFIEKDFSKEQDGSDLKTVLEPTSGEAISQAKAKIKELVLGRLTEEALVDVLDEVWVNNPRVANYLDAARAIRKKLEEVL